MVKLIELLEEKKHLVEWNDEPFMIRVTEHSNVIVSFQMKDIKHPTTLGRREIIWDIINYLDKKYPDKKSEIREHVWESDLTRELHDDFEKSTNPVTVKFREELNQIGTVFHTLLEAKTQEYIHTTIERANLLSEKLKNDLDAYFGNNP